MAHFVGQHGGLEPYADLPKVLGRAGGLEPHADLPEVLGHAGGLEPIADLPDADKDKKKKNTKNPKK